MPLCYRQNLTVNIFECDPWDRMRPGAVLRRVQRIATAQCESLGIDEAFYQRTHTVFLLSRMSLLVNRMPTLYEPVMIETRAYGMRKAVYHRVTSLHAENGDKLCETDARWVLVDTETRRILRQPLPEFEPFFNDVPGAEEHDMKMPKLRDADISEATGTQIAELRAVCSLCDRNGHLNNTHYADLMCDLLPEARLREGPPRRMLFNYHSEIPFGAAFTLHSVPCPGEGGRYFLALENEPENAADRGKSKNFEGFLEY